MINLLFLNNFYLSGIITTSSKRKATNYCIRSLVTVRNQLPAQVVKHEGVKLAYEWKKGHVESLLWLEKEEIIR